MTTPKFPVLVLFVGLTSVVSPAWSADDALPSESTTPAIAAPLSLDAAIRLALEANSELRAASGRVESATGRAQQARAWTNPEVEFAAEDWPLHEGRGYSDAKRTIGITQAVPFPGKKSLDKQIGGAGVKFSEAELALRRRELVRDVKIGYVRIVAFERFVESSAQRVVVAESLAATARKKVAAGAVAYQEQLRAEVQAEQARLECADFERDLAAARQTFASLLGRPDLCGAKLSDRLTETPDLELLGNAVVTHLDRHPSVNAAEANLSRAELSNRRARLEPYPDVKVGVAGGKIGETGASIGQLSFSLPLPILDRGKGLKREARANVYVATAELNAVRQGLRRDLANAVMRYRAASEQVGNYRERILPKAAEALQLARAGFEQGKYSFIDLIDTQRTVAEVQLSHLQKLLEMNIAQAELEALTAEPKPPAGAKD